MTTETTSGPTIELPDGRVACRSCGVSIPEPEEADGAYPPIDPFDARLEAHRIDRGYDPVPRAVVPVGLCAACEDRHALARRLVDRLDRATVREIGGRESTLPALARTLHVMAALDRRPDPERPATYWAAAIYYTSRSLAMLGYPGEAARIDWEAAPVFNRKVAATSPWSWLSTETRDRLAHALVSIQHEEDVVAKVGVSRELPHPTAGCAICGVNVITVDTRQAHRARTNTADVRRVFWRARARGAWACPPCADAARGHGERDGTLRAALLAAGVAAEYDAAVRSGLDVRVPSPPSFRQRLMDKRGEQASAGPVRFEHLVNGGGLTGFADLVRERIEEARQRAEAPPDVRLLAEQVARLVRPTDDGPEAA